MFSDILALLKNKDMQYEIIRKFINTLGSDRKLLALAYELLKDLATDNETRKSMKIIYKLLETVLSETES